MSSVKHYVANAHGEFNAELLAKIESGFEAGRAFVEDRLHADRIDVVFVNAPSHTIPEMGIGGHSPGPFNIYVSLDPNYKNLLEEDVASTVVHEAHHCMRYRKPGYGQTLGEAIISEGLASLFEEEYSGKQPIYTQVEIKPAEVEKAKKLLSSKQYNHGEWFFGSKEVQRWFGYTYGYQLCKAYSAETGKRAAELVDVLAKLVLNQ